MMGGRVGEKKNEINAILNSVEVKVEVGVELGKNKDSVKVESLTRRRSIKRLKKRKPYLPA